MHHISRHSPISGRQPLSYSSPIRDYVANLVTMDGWGARDRVAGRARPAGARWDDSEMAAPMYCGTHDTVGTK